MKIVRRIATIAIVMSLSHHSVTADEANEDLIKLIVGLLSEKDNDLRALGFEQIRSGAPGNKATERFAAELPKLSDDAKVGLLSALATRGDAAAKPAVLEQLTNSKVESVRVAAILSLGSLGDATDVHLLVQELSADAAAEKQAAKVSLVKLTSEGTVAAIVKESRSADPLLRSELIQILLVRRATAAVPDLLKAAVAESSVVRTAAMQALSELASPQDMEAMVQGVLKAEPGVERVQAEKAVMLVCQQIDDPDQRAAPLLAVIAELPESDRRAMLSTVARIGGQSALQVVEVAVASDDAELHDLGIKAMCNWPDATIASRLLELAKKYAGESEGIALLRATMRVATLPDERTDAERLELLKTALSLSERAEEKLLAIDRARAIRTTDALEFVLPFTQQKPFAEAACFSIVELAHHRGLREPNKDAFDLALDQVIAISRDPVVIDRAKRYKSDETWVRPK